MPEENEKDLEEVPEFVKDELEFLFVKDVNEVIEQVLGERREGDAPAEKEDSPETA